MTTDATKTTAGSSPVERPFGRLADGLTDAEIQAMFDRPPTAEEERYDQIRAEIDALGNIDPRPLLVMQRLEIQRRRTEHQHALDCFDAAKEEITRLQGENAVFLGWSHAALRVLETIEGEDQEDGGEAIRKLCDSGRKLVHEAMKKMAT